MSRSGYVDDYDDEHGEWELIRWRGAVKSALRGARGQAFLREALAALDALPAQRLISSDLENGDGDVCFLGAVGRARNLDMAAIDPEAAEAVAAAFGIAPAMAREIVFENDEAFRNDTPEHRYSRMKQWARSWLKEESE